MEQSSSYDEKTVMHQFDRKCKLALKGETVDYERHLAYLRKHETLFSELSEQEMESLSIFDEYELEKSYYSWALFWHIPSTYASYRILLRNNIRKFSN